MRRFKAQMLALAACRMQLGYQTANRVVNLKFDPIESFEAWLQIGEDQLGMWPGVMTLSGKFFATLTEHAVPLDQRAIAELQNSALALDTYTWLAHRLCRIRKDAGVALPWSALRGQFGQEYRSDKDFKRELVRALRKALAVYPAARVDQVRGGLRLLPSPPPIARKAVVVKLPAPAVTPATEQRLAVPELPLRHRITEDGLDRLRDACPGWDRQWLLLRYLEFMSDKPAPKNADASLVAWGRKFTKGKAP
jgi:hypothetical protein